VAFGIADDDNGLEARALTGAGLLLHGLDLRVIGNARVSFFLSIQIPQNTSPDPASPAATPQTPPSQDQKPLPHLHNLILQLRQEEIHNLELLDRQTVQVYLLHALDLARLDQPAQLRDGLPLLLLALCSASSGSASSSAASSIAASVAAPVPARAKAASTSTSTSASCSPAIAACSSPCASAVGHGCDTGFEVSGRLRKGRGTFE